MEVYFHENAVLFNGGQVAFDAACCCDEPVTECDGCSGIPSLPVGPYMTVTLNGITFGECQDCVGCTPNCETLYDNKPRVVGRWQTTCDTANLNTWLLAGYYCYHPPDGAITLSSNCFVQIFKDGVTDECVMRVTFRTRTSLHAAVTAIFENRRSGPFLNTDSPVVCDLVSVGSNPPCAVNAGATATVSW